MGKSKAKSGNSSAKKTLNEIAASPELIKESMKCPVCMEVLLSPIYQCERGHNICNLCVEQVHECPLCKGEYGDTRNYFAEDLVNSLTWPCKYEEYGCRTSCLGSALREHQENCEHQPYRCPELACQELLGKCDMAKHLDRHGFKVVSGEYPMVAIIDIQDKHFDTKTEYNPWRIQIFGHEFYTVATRHRDRNWYMWSWILGSPKEAKKYSTEIILTASQKQVLYRGPVHSLRTPHDELAQSGNALVLTDQFVKAFREEGKISCRVRFTEGRTWKPEIPLKQNALTQSKKDRKAMLTIPSKVKVKTPYGLPLHLKRTSSVASATYIPTMSKISKSSISSLVTPVPLVSVKLFPMKPNKSITSPRSKPSVSEAEQNLVLKIRESLKCPGCGECIFPPIQLCTVGHCVCETCRVKYGSNCPLCRCPLTGTRNFFAEELLYKSVQKCRFHPSGCDVCLPAVQIRLHELDCNFAPFECPFSSCRRIVEPKELLDHMKSHGISTARNELKMPIPYPKATNAPICAIPSIVVFQGQAFYPLVLRETNGTWAFWVACASASDAIKYVYEVCIRKHSKVLAYQGQVVPLRMSPNQVVLRGEGLLTTAKLVKNFKTQEAIEFSLKIGPLKGFVKSGVAFMTPLFSKSDQMVAATELYANKATSKGIYIEGSDSNVGIFIETRVMTREDEDSDDSTSKDSSAHSMKKCRSDNSLLTSEEEMYRITETDVSETTDYDSEFDEPGDTDKSCHKTQNVEDLGNVSSLRSEIDIAPDGVKRKVLSKAQPPKKVVKKKSSLKLREKDSTKDLSQSKESTTSLKKVDFNPTTEVLNVSSNETLDDDKDKNNNWVQSKRKTKVLVGTVEPVHGAVAAVLNTAEKFSKGDVERKMSTSPSTKVETYSHSCTDINSCGSREQMKSKFQQVSDSLRSIKEEDEDSNKLAEEDSDSGACTANSDRNEDCPHVNESLEKGASIDIGSCTGPVRLIIRSEDQLTSLSLTNVNTKASDTAILVRGSNSRGKVQSNFNIEIPLPTLPLSPTESYEELIEETDTACQVGSSLIRLAEEEAKAPYASVSLLDLSLKESYASVTTGLATSFNTVKNIMSSIIPKTKVENNNLDENKASLAADTDPVLDVGDLEIDDCPVARLPSNY